MLPVCCLSILYIYHRGCSTNSLAFLLQNICKCQRSKECKYSHYYFLKLYINQSRLAVPLLKLFRGWQRCMQGHTIYIPIYTYKTWILSVCVFVCPNFPKPPKVPGSWNLGSRLHLGKLKSLIFEIMIFKGGPHMV